MYNFLAQGLEMHTKPWVRARASKDYWEKMRPAGETKAGDYEFVPTLPQVDVHFVRPCPNQTTGELLQATRCWNRKYKNQDEIDLSYSWSKI